MRKSVVDEVGGQQPLPHAHDMEMWFRIAAFSEVGYLIGADQAWHREHSASLSQLNTDIIQERRERRDAFETLFRGMVGSVSGAADLHRMARRALAKEALEDACQWYDRGKPDAVETAERLSAFAAECFPDITGDRLWAQWEGRRRAGPQPFSPIHLAAAARRGAARRIQARRWERTGVYESLQRLG